ncbi:MAG: flagellar filament capping protein FliD [Deltaproteobacteria bacterium]|nr:flagellar filament capping protein FliD [Deltaproteobacteria bacterium]
MTGGVTFSGLASGLDTGKIIEALVKLAQSPIDKAEARKSELGAHRTAYSNLRGLVGALQSLASEADSPSELLGFSSTSSDPSVTRVSSDGSASPGSYSVSVNHLAAAQRSYSSTFASSSAEGLLGSGTLDIKVGTDDVVSVDIDTHSTLEELRDAINRSEADVSASIVFDGAEYRLALSGLSQGADRAILFTENGTTTGLGGPGSTVQAAQDAEIEVDGITIHRSSNSIRDAIAGLTLDLVRESPGPVTIEVSRSATGTIDKVKKLVDGYNAVVDAISKETKYSGAVDRNRLVGDPTLGQLRNELSAVLRSSGSSGTYSSLFEVGLSLGRDGRLNLDEAKLEKAVLADGSSVAALLTAKLDEDGFSGLMERLDGLADRFADPIEGRLTSRVHGIDGRVGLIDADIDRLTLHLTKYEQRLRAQFSALETAMSKLKAQQSTLTQFFAY